MTATRHRFPPGSLVRARHREWIVLPGSTTEQLHLRPLTGSEEEGALLDLQLEPDVTPAAFPWPSASQEGGQADAQLLHDALRLSLRRGAGPFRSFGQVDITPRPYQLVPLMMALAQETVRLLIADDVGLGKTIEALLIARELYDRGEISRLAVLCPPHLVDQWVRELTLRFHLPAQPVTSGSATRLERGLPQGTSLFEAHPFTVVSLDYIKSVKRRDEFARSCPEAIIVDEAHSCTTGVGTRHQRYQLLTSLLAAPGRHAILCTATPHSGDETAFVRLLALLDPRFEALGSDQEPPAALRDALAGHMVQRRRIDIREWHDESLFPTRESADRPYRLTGRWEAFLEQVLAYCEGVTQAAGTGVRERRLAFWGTLALLRCVSSSPAAALRALQTRLAGGANDEDAGRWDAGLEEQLEEQLFELDPAEGNAPLDAEPAADTGTTEVRALLAEACALAGDGDDPKLQKALDEVGALLAEGFSPIVFCHYIATANYVADRFRQALRLRFPELQVQAVTGEHPPEARIDAVEALDRERPRVLVATDCLSEGVNLQHAFDAVVHYDLSWNPTRHEQREGRVDRYGQAKPLVRTVLLYGSNNPVDGAVLQVIIAKAKRIAERLGVPVPLPDDDRQLTEALLKAVLLRRRGRSQGDQLLMELEGLPEAQAVDTAWRNAEERARRAVTKFSQRRLKHQDVASEFDRAQQALGNLDELVRFVERGCARVGAAPMRGDRGVLRIPVADLDPALRDRLAQAGYDTPQLRVVPGEKPVGAARPMRRSHPLPTLLAETLLERTLDADGALTSPAVLGRVGVWPTTAVTTRTVLLLARMRHELAITVQGRRQLLLVEEGVPVAVVAGANAPLTDHEAARLLEAPASGTLGDGPRRAQLDWLEQRQEELQCHLATVAQRRAQQLLADHRRVRKASEGHGRYDIRALQPVDVIGVWMLLPEVRA
jgi:superfamily II DNA or RNA helicase